MNRLILTPAAAAIADPAGLLASLRRATVLGMKETEPAQPQIGTIDVDVEGPYTAEDALASVTRVLADPNAKITVITGYGDLTTFDGMNLQPTTDDNKAKGQPVVTFNYVGMGTDGGMKLLLLTPAGQLEIEIEIPWTAVQFQYANVNGVPTLHALDTESVLHTTTINIGGEEPTTNKWQTVDVDGFQPNDILTTNSGRVYLATTSGLYLRDSKKTTTQIKYIAGTHGIDIKSFVVGQQGAKMFHGFVGIKDGVTALYEIRKVNGKNPIVTQVMLDTEIPTDVMVAAILTGPVLGTNFVAVTTNESGQYQNLPLTRSATPVAEG